ncbi:MAG: PAS domain S-box protein [Microscillaceae bacterium]|nr:PAS domain S-box protein [Microscillaceae bacterium]
MIFLNKLIQNIYKGITILGNPSHSYTPQKTTDPTRKLLSKLPVLVFACDTQGKFSFWNEACEQLTGYSFQEISLNPKPLALLYPELGNNPSIQHIIEPRIPPALFTLKGVQKRIQWQPIQDLALDDTQEQWYLGINITKKVFHQELLQLQTESIEKLSKKYPIQIIFRDLTLHINQLLPGNLSTVMLVQKDGKHLDPTDCPQIPPEIVDVLHSFPIGPNAASCGAAAYYGKRVITEDISQDPNWEGYQALALKYGLKACWSEPIKSEQGKVLGTFALYLRHARKPSALEITLMKKTVWVASLIIQTYQAEEKLQESENRFRTIFEKSLNPIFIADDEGYYLDVNQAAADVMGYPIEAMKGMHVSKLQIIDHPSPLKSYEKYLQKGREINELSFKRPDGQIRTALYQAIHISKDLNLSILSDITERIEMERELQKNKELFETFMDHLPGIVFILDAEHKTIYVNKKMREIHPIKEIIGKSASDLFPPEVAAKMTYYNHKTLTEGYQVNREEIAEPNGKVSVYETHRFPILRDSEALLLGAFALDISDRVKAERELEEYRKNLEKLVQERTLELEAMNKDLEAFVYSVSHDLRAPLRHIDGFSQILFQNIQNPSQKTQRYVDKIRTSIHKMSTMIDDLLKFSRLGRASLQKKPIDLNHLIAEVIAEFKPDLAHQEVKWIMGELPIIEGDYNLLRMVFENLISNALKFSAKSKPSTIEINTNPHGPNKCTIFVRDNGVGFDMAHADKLFKVFQRLHTEDEFEGTGIGLANVQQIVKKHGGSIWAYAEPGKGATFCLNF